MSSPIALLYAVIAFLLLCAVDVAFALLFLIGFLLGYFRLSPHDTD